MKIRSKGSQLFNVPNDEEGREFVRLARKFKNKEYRILIRGRASKRKQRYAAANRNVTSFAATDGIPFNISDWGAVYVHPTWKRQQEIARRAREAEKRGEEARIRYENERRDREIDRMLANMG